MLQLFVAKSATAQKVDFTPSAVSGCSPLNVKFDDASSGGGGILSRKWTLDNGNPVINDSLSVQTNYNTPRTYNIKLVIKFVNGITDSVTKQVIVHPNPIPDFLASSTTACAPADIQFTDKSTTSTGTITSWTWNLDLSTSTTQNPAQLFTSTGSYKINLLVKNNWGCNTLLSKPDFIKIVDKPVVSFSISPKSSCTDTLTIFTTNDSKDAPTFLWDFGDGSTETGKQPSHFYGKPGSYTVSLSSVISAGCEDKKTTVVTIGKPVAEIVNFPDTVCEKEVATFTGKATPAGATGRWLFSDKNQPVNSLQANYTFVTAGTYDVSFIVSNSWGCDSIITRSIYVRPKPLLDFDVSPQSTCSNSLTVICTYKGTALPKFVWDFGDGSTSTDINPTHFYSLPGSYKLTLQDLSSGCPNKLTKTVNVGRPQAEFVLFRDTVCEDQQVLFGGKITPADAPGTWLFSDKNQQLSGNSVSYIFTNPGVYEVFFIAANNLGCNDTTRKSIYVTELPKPAFSLDTATSCKVPFTVQTINLTPGNNLEFTWNFGDGKPLVKGFAPSHTYTSFGIFDITLTVKDTSNSAGCTAVLIKRQAIRIVQPGASIIPGPYRNCNPPVDVDFTVSTSNFLDTPVSYIWDMGDGQKDTTLVPSNSHTYLKTGNFTVTATIVSGSGCSAVTTTRVSILNTCPPNPDTVILVTYMCNPCNKITLRDTVAKTTVTRWIMGDGTIINGNGTSSVTHLFPDSLASYTVKVERRNTITQEISGTTVEVKVLCMKPVFTSNKSATCIGDSILFTPVNVDSNLIREYNWDFGDGTTRLVANTRLPYVNGSTGYAYKNTGINYVRLTITDNRSQCRFVSDSLPIIIEGPKANFSSSQRTTCDSSFTVFFKDSSTLNGGAPIVKWEWNFGDGTSNYQSLQDSAIARRYTGNNLPVTAYNVYLKVTDSFGCTGTITKTKQIALYRPKAAFSSADTLHCNRFVASFNNETKAAGTPSYSWNLGDAYSSSDVNPRFTFNGEGMYDIKLTVKDENGCVDSTTKPNYIKIVKPVARMSISDSSECWPNPISFKDSSTYAMKYLWDFGDGRSLSQDKDRSRTYDGPGDYLVKLVITGPDGCKDTASQQIRIKGSIGRAVVDATIGCKPFTTTMRVLDRFNIKDYTWDFGDGTVTETRPGDSIITHTYKSEGIYVPNVIYQSTEGCLKYDSSKPVIIDFAAAKFGVGQSVICESGSSAILDSSRASYISSITRYSWDFGNGQKSNLPSPPPPVYNQPGSYTIKLDVESRYGCRDTFELPNVIKAFAKPVATINGADSSCQNTAAVFSSIVTTQDSISVLRWFLNGLEKGTGESVKFDFKQAGAMNIVLQVQTKYGCDVSTGKKVKINPGPVPAVTALPDTAICVNNVVALRASDGVRYAWTPAATLSSANAANPMARPLPGRTTYLVDVTNAFNCSAKDSIIIRTDDSVVVTTMSPAEVCLESGLLLQATSNAKSFLWSPAESLSDPSALMPRASPKTATRYQVIAVGKNACPDDTAFVFVKVNPVPSVQAFANPTNTLAGTYVMLSSKALGENLTYRWEPAALVSNPGTSTTYWRADNNRTFTVNVINQFGCIAADSVDIDVSCDATTVSVPNAFTPGRTPNNRLRPLSAFKNNPMINRFQVFNRWGGIVYQVNNMYLNDIPGWDGLLGANNSQDTGGFPWVLEMRCGDTKVAKKGIAFVVH